MQLDDRLAAAVMDPAAALELRVPPVWKDRNSTARAEIAVHNSHGLPLILGAQVITAKPWKFTLYLMLYNTHIRRLDVNGSHRNKMGDRELWVERTHKHRFSDQYGDSEAYTPSDIPGIPLTDVTGEHYREVFEAFCGECGIGLTHSYVWIAPAVGMGSLTLDGEE